jgi:hypothetical protein
MLIPPPSDTWYHRSMRKIIYAALCLTAVLVTRPACEAQPLPLPPQVGDLVPTSPKEAWGDLGAIQSGEGSPWWSDVLLYIPNRVLDLIDVFRVDVGVGASVGAVVRVTEYAQLGYRQMAPVSLRVGDFGRQFPVLVETSNEIGVSPAFKQSADRDVCSAEIGLGGDLLIVGAYGGICLDELADFVGGLFLIDFKDDDM